MEVSARFAAVVNTSSSLGSGGRRVVAGSVVGGAHNGWVTLVQPMLPLWDEPLPDHRQRVVAHVSDRVAWVRARSRGVTATDVARLSSAAAVKSVVIEKLTGRSFGGNAYTEHGREREPAIARWAHKEHGITPSATLYHAHSNKLHLATPDGIRVNGTTVELCEIKTTVRGWRTIPRSYLRQVFWQQYVLGAERTLVVWEQHDDFVPVAAEPRCKWVDRDDNEIHMLVHLADQVLAGMRP